MWESVQARALAQVVSEYLAVVLVVVMADESMLVLVRATPGWPWEAMVSTSAGATVEELVLPLDEALALWWGEGMVPLLDAVLGLVMAFW